jgi:hypothetical protein
MTEVPVRCIAVCRGFSTRSQKKMPVNLKFLETGVEDGGMYCPPAAWIVLAYAQLIGL